MTQADKARRFADLHVKGNPVVLYNIWDAGSAKAVLAAGAPAIATGSWSVAAAHGYADGESIPLSFVETIVTRITATVEAPVTVDFEGGYADQPDGAAKNVARIVAAGAIGINFEDQIVGGGGLYDVARQSQRIRAIRSRAAELGIPIVINARTDLFLQAKDRREHGGLIEEAKVRAAAYGEAGASSYFVPGLIDEERIADLCRSIALPVNVMMMQGAPTIERLAALGVARVSFGPIPFLSSMAALTEQAGAVYRPART